MNFSRPLLVVLCVFFSLQCAYAQPTSTFVVNERYEGLTRQDILSDLQNNYEVQISFNPDWLSQEKINIAFVSKPLQKVIEQLIEGQGLELYIYQDLFVLMPSQEVALITGNVLPESYYEAKIDYASMQVVGEFDASNRNQPVTFSGRIIDGANGESLIGATVVVNNSNLYTISDVNGHFELKMQPGIYELTISSVGFENKYVTIQLLGKGSITIELFEKSQQIDELRIYAQKADRNISSSQMSLIQLDSKTLKQLPTLTGEKDVLKSLTMMPGVNSVGEFGAGIQVRGGSEDQNLFLLENSPLFNTAHAMGFLSVVNPDIVSGVDLYKGHIPAEYGERVSSVVDISIKDYDIDKSFRARGGLGIYNSRLVLEGQLADQRITYKLGGRISYSDYLLKQIPDYYLNRSSASFYDLNGLIDINLKRDHITLSAYNSYDYFDYADLYVFDYSNQLGNVTWVHRFGDDIATEISVAYSGYSINREELTDSLNINTVASSIEYLSPKLSITYSGLEGHHIKFGGQMIDYQLEPGEQVFPGEDDAQNINLEKENGTELALFLNDIWTVSDKISIQYGVRYSTYTNHGPGRVYEYQDDAPRSNASKIDSTSFKDGEKIVSYQGLEPRLSFKYQLSKTNAIKLSYNLNRQYISRISYTSISSPEDVWKLSDTYIKPIKVHQVAAGYFHNFLANTIEASAEIYYKRLFNLVDYKNGAKLTMNPHIETEVLSADGYNYGIEVLVRKNYGRIDGWVGYTYSRSFRQTSGNYPSEMINRNEIYPSAYDKPHDLTIYLNYHHNRRLRIGLNFNLASGRSVTMPEYVFNYGQNQLVYYSDRNKYRLPPYHRLDLSISYDESLKKKKKWKGSWTFSILNVYGRNNAYSVFYRKEAPNIQNDYQIFSLYKLYLIGQPMPVLTYNFIF